MGKSWKLNRNYTILCATQLRKNSSSFLLFQCFLGKHRTNKTAGRGSWKFTEDLGFIFHPSAFHLCHRCENDSHGLPKGDRSRKRAKGDGTKSGAQRLDTEGTSSSGRTGTEEGVTTSGVTSPAGDELFRLHLRDRWLWTSRSWVTHITQADYSSEMLVTKCSVLDFVFWIL